TGYGPNSLHTADGCACLCNRRNGRNRSDGCTTKHRAWSELCKSFDHPVDALVALLREAARVRFTYALLVPCDPLLLPLVVVKELVRAGPLGDLLADLLAGVDDVLCAPREAHADGLTCARCCVAFTSLVFATRLRALHVFGGDSVRSADRL